MLRLAEGILRSGQKVSIFALDYDLAPESVFPVQMRQATAAYSWLANDVGIQPRQLLVAGDSAGGHLALSLMCNIYCPLDGGTSTDHKHQKQFPKPGLGVVLISPWLSLTDEPDSFRRNAVTDVLEGRWLFDIGLQFAGAKSVTSVPSKSLPWIEFYKHVDPPIRWTDVLPEWTWVSAGCNEVIYDTIAAWVKARQEDCRGAVESELDRRETHVYAWLKTLDPAVRKRLLCQNYQSNILPPDSAFEDVDRLAEIILTRRAQLNNQ